MESFVKWGKEKRQLDEVLGTALAVGAVAHGAVYLWKKGAERTDAKNPWWVYKRDAEEGDKKKAFDGISIVKMWHTGELKKDDYFIPPGAQNWMKIGDDEKKRKYLPWNQVGEGGTTKTGFLGDPSKAHVRVTDKTKWVAFIDGKRVVYEDTAAFVKAIRARDIEADTHVWHDGYGQKWKRYDSKDVQSEIAPFVAKAGSADDLPSMGDEKLLGAPAKYMINGQVYDKGVRFEDLATAGLENDSWVFIRKYKNEWVRFKEIKKMLPSVGQAHVLNPRGGLRNFGRWLGGHRTIDREEPKKDAWKDGKTSLPDK